MTGKQEIILNSAIRLFSRQGFRKTSVDEIARAARVSKATIYQLFGDKSGLLGEVYLRKAHELKERMIQSVDQEETPVPRLLKMLNFAREFCCKDPLFNQLLVQREVEEIEAIPQFDQVIAEAVTVIDEVLVEGIERGEIRPMPTKMAAYFFFRIGFYLSYYGQELFDRFPSEDVLKLFNSVLTNGIVPDPLKNGSDH